MELREREIRAAGEKLVNEKLSVSRRVIYNWVLKHTRAAVKRRENLRFDRTKAFGLTRKLFRAIGFHFESLDVLEHKEDLFYLTVEEIISYIEGRSVTNRLSDIVKIRKEEYEEFRNTMDPPDRFFTYGAVGFSEKLLNYLRCRPFGL